MSICKPYNHKNYNCFYRDIGNGFTELVSYTTTVAFYDAVFGKFIIIGDWANGDYYRHEVGKFSATTTKHVNAFLNDFGCDSTIGKLYKGRELPITIHKDTANNLVDDLEYIKGAMSRNAVVCYFMRDFVSEFPQGN